jgi:hypothetical protein
MARMRHAPACRKHPANPSEETTVLKFLSALLAWLALSCPALAETVSNDFYKVDVPESWEMIQNNNQSGIYINVYTTATRDATLTTAISSAGNADMTLIAESFAEQYGANDPPVIKENHATFSYENFEGVDSTAFMALQNGQYIIVTIAGDLAKGKAFLKEFRSEKFPSFFTFDF